MASRPPTPADLEQIGYAKTYGYEVSVRQLERWRQAGALPQRYRPGRGQGPGRPATNPPHALHQLVQLCAYLTKTRRLAEAMLWIWYFGGDISPDWVRARLEGWIGRVEANYESRLETLAAARPRDHQPDSLDVAEDEAVAATPRLPRKESARAKAAAELLLDPDHPAEDEVQPREALISVRTQLAQALMGDSSFEPNIPAIAAQLGFDRLDDIEGRPREQSHVELKNTWPHLSVSELRHGLAQASDDDLRTITKQLRFNYDLVQAMRKSPSGTIRAQGLETDVLYDPRDPDYRESSLLTALVIGLKLLQLQDASE